MKLRALVFSSMVVQRLFGNFSYSKFNGDIYTNKTKLTLIFINQSSASIEAKRWCEAMRTKNSGSNEELAMLLGAAIDAHNKYMKSATFGRVSFIFTKKIMKKTQFLCLFVIILGS